jgi:hypothetical protein
MAGIDAKHVLELAAAKDQQPVEALATHATDPALGVRVRVRRLDRRTDHSDSSASEDVIEARGVQKLGRGLDRCACLLER